MSVPLNQSGGGSGGTTLTGTGLARDTGVCTELSGAVTTSGSNATTIQSSLALPGSPTTTTQASFDNSTKVATTAYVDAEVPAITASPAEYVLPWGEGGPASAGLTAVVVDSTTNRCRFVMFSLPYTLKCTTMTINVPTTVNTQHIYMGIYDAANTTLLGQWTFTLTASTGIYTTTKVGGGSVTLPPGKYMFVWASDSATPTISGMPTTGGVGNIFTSMLNKNVTRVGQGAVGSVVSSGTMPPNLGTLVATNVNVPAAMMEP